MSTSTPKVNAIEKLSLQGYIERIVSLKGTFKGEIRWCSNPILKDWKIHYLQITKLGSLTHSVNRDNIADDEVNKISSLSLTDSSLSTKHAVIKHLSGCRLQVLVSNDKPIIKVTEKGEASNDIYLSMSNEQKFLDLFCSLTWWSALKLDGAFNKMTLINNKMGKMENNDITEIFKSDIEVYGPLPDNFSAEYNNTLENFNSFSPADGDVKWGWFPATCSLKSNGVLELSYLNEGNWMGSIDITMLLKSEIRHLNRSVLIDSNCIFLGMLPLLRKELNISSLVSIFHNGLDRMNCNNIILRFPLRRSLEDWLVTLKSFAISEVLCLSGADKSNELRVSNEFVISILEADLQALNLVSNGKHSFIYAEISMWDQVWAKTPSVHDTDVPFWREEYEFKENIQINNITIRIIEENEQDSIITKQILGTVELNQNDLNNEKFRIETRLPIYTPYHSDFQVGTLCLRIKSQLDFVLPSVNFSKFEATLLDQNFSKLVNIIYCDSIKSVLKLKLEDISEICLDLFQSMGRETAWFQALTEREIADIDKSVVKNANNNQTSAHIFNTLFRGNSILTKSTELYFFRIGSEYLNKAIGSYLREISNSEELFELDPARIKLPANEKSVVIMQNHEKLINWAGKIWKRINETSNDLPKEIRLVMKNFRRELEKICLNDDLQTILNCVSGFLFLRFFCPVILNPKLFDFTENHLTENARRNLTLISKILLNLSTVKHFGNKEPWMSDVNVFIDDHKVELKDYIDKITEKKLDFTTKFLNLDADLPKSKVRFNQEELKELPVNPFMIDKYLKQTQFVQILNNLSNSKGSNKKDVDKNGAKLIEKLDPSKVREINIGELEFEKITENNAEVFGEEFMKYLEVDENEESNVTFDNESKNDSMLSMDPADSLKQLLQEVSWLKFKMDRIINLMKDYEYPTDDMIGNRKYALELAKSIYHSENKSILIDKEDMFGRNDGLAQLFSGLNKNSLSNTKLFQRARSTSLITSSSSSSSEMNERTEFYMGNTQSPSSTRLSKLANIIKGNSSQDNKIDLNHSHTRISPGMLSRWFKKSKD